MVELNKITTRYQAQVKRIQVALNLFQNNPKNSKKLKRRKTKKKRPTTRPKNAPPPPNSEPISESSENDSTEDEAEEKSLQDESDDDQLYPSTQESVDGSTLTRRNQNQGITALNQDIPTKQPSTPTQPSSSTSTPPSIPAPPTPPTTHQPPPPTPPAIDITSVSQNSGGNKASVCSYRGQVGDDEGNDEDNDVLNEDVAAAILNSLQQDQFELLKKKFLNVSAVENSD